MIIATILKMVIGSAAEAKVAALYHCAQELVPFRQACIKLRHPQPATPMRTDNSTADENNAEAKQLTWDSTG